MLKIVFTFFLKCLWNFRLKRLEYFKTLMFVVKLTFNNKYSISTTSFTKRTSLRVFDRFKVILSVEKHSKDYTLSSQYPIIFFQNRDFMRIPPRCTFNLPVRENRINKSTEVTCFQLSYNTGLFFIVFFPRIMALLFSTAE